MKLQLLPWFSTKNPNSQHLLAMLAVALLGLVPLTAAAQAADYIGLDILTLPISGLSLPSEIAVDSTGNVFVVNETNLCCKLQSILVEYPKTASGYGPGETLPVSL